jgi:hypothetical protein
MTGYARNVGFTLAEKTSVRVEPPRINEEAAPDVGSFTRPVRQLDTFQLDIAGTE